MTVHELRRVVGGPDPASAPEASDPISSLRRTGPDLVLVAWRVKLPLGG